MSKPLLDLSDVGVRAIEMKTRTRKSNVPTLIGAKVKERTWPIRHLDFTMQPGETVFVTDVGGSRPAVFFRVVCGMIPIDEGKARLPTRTVLSHRMRGRLVRGLSLGQAIRMMCGLHGLPDRGIERRFDEMVEFAEVGRHLHQTVDMVPRHLMQQAMFTTAAFVPADLYTFDGTGFVGSAAFRQKCGGRLRELAEQGKGVLISASGQRLVTQYGDRGLVLDGEHSRDVPVAEFVGILADKTKPPGRKRRRKKRQ